MYKKTDCSRDLSFENGSLSNWNYSNNASFSWRVIIHTMSIVAQETKEGRDRRVIQDYKEWKDQRAKRVSFDISILLLFAKE